MTATTSSVARWNASICAVLLTLVCARAASQEFDGGTVVAPPEFPVEHDHHILETRVEAEAPTSAASAEIIRERDLVLRPKSTPEDILRVVPGLVIAQHQGGGKADQLFLRGFDADHGTDVALFLDGVPVNTTTLADTMRQRAEMREEILAATAQSRASSLIITLLPVAAALFLYFLTPEYFRPMLTSPLGWVMIGIAAMMLLIGNAIIRRITAIG